MMINPSVNACILVCFGLRRRLKQQEGQSTVHWTPWSGYAQLTYLTCMFDNDWNGRVGFPMDWKVAVYKSKWIHMMYVRIVNIRLSQAVDIFYQCAYMSLISMTWGGHIGVILHFSITHYMYYYIRMTSCAYWFGTNWSAKTWYVPFAMCMIIEAENSITLGMYIYQYKVFIALRRLF